MVTQHYPVKGPSEAAFDLVSIPIGSGLPLECAALARILPRETLGHRGALDEVVHGAAFVVLVWQIEAARAQMGQAP